MNYSQQSQHWSYVESCENEYQNDWVEDARLETRPHSPK